MVQWHGRSKRKKSGGRYVFARKKRKRELARPPAETHKGTAKKKLIRTRGGNLKVRLLRDEYVNLVGKDGRCKKLEIEDIIDNPANKDFARRKIITRGAIIQTSDGQALVTSRPGQDGVIQAKLI